MTARMLPLTDSLRVNQMLPGVHKLRRIRGGRHIEYWYAWRGAGAPLILSASGATREQLVKADRRKHLDIARSGLASAIRRARLAVIEHVQKAHGPDAPPPPLEGLHLHDLRGTAATFFLQAGIEEKQVADLLGWDIERVHEIAKRYVSADAIAEGMLAKLEFKNRKKT